MAVFWLDSVNHKAFNENGSFEQNVISQKFESGIERLYLKNSSSKKIHSISINMKYKPNEDCEFKRFLYWYDNFLLSRSENFYFPNILNPSDDKDTWKEYKMTSEPTWSGQNPKTVSFNIEEV